MNSRATPAKRGKNLPKIPPPPGTLSERAAMEWRAIAPVLVAEGNLSECNLRGFQLLCEVLAGVRDLEDTLRADGSTVRAGSGGVKSHPALKGLSEGRALARQLLHDFGLLPKAKAAAPAPPVFRRWTGVTE